MSSDIYAKPDFSKKVRYNRKVEEDGGEWEEREVDIYESTDDIRDDVTDIQSQEEVHRKSFRGAALCLAVLCLLMAAGIIVLSTHRKIKIDNLIKNYSQSQNEVKQLQDKISRKLCPEGWKKFGCSCYFKSTERKSWSESRRFCQDRGSDLVIINSKEEQDFVTELNQHEDFWIGLWQQWSETQYQWKWVDGSQLTETFWATGEKHPTGFYASCCDKQGRWKSERYYDKNWICEKKICCFLWKVRYNRKVEEDGGEWEEREVDIYESTDVIRDDVTDIQSQENHPPVHRKSFRGAALCLAVLCLLMAAGIIVLSTYLHSVTKEKELQSRIDNLNKSYNELQDKMSHTSVTNSQLQDEIKQLKDKIQGKSCPEGWKRFGCSCYFKSTEKKSWSDSRKDCVKRESDLVIFNSKEEQDFVTELNQHEDFWIGLWNQWSDTERKYQWEWVDGSQPTETFWATGEKHPTGYFASCCDQQGRWRSEHDYYYKNWICEKKICCFL
ncbi:C-type lectin domain family 12 member B [Channa argus]|uniref:C-type lectin domain family 12 member B n=1 Tax=Channa argus TaxID=215402 RepID=A0A6G1QWX7_CHAAH|nr:C-type lectin domain family 12 member B [Channa argus]